jgi:exopolyphosphatase/guanosine-5'-triphosphate,3'-diphosphate pyrophosphatase
MRAGVIDIGSSSVKLVIGEKDEDQIKVLESLKSVLPIGKSTFLKGRISQDIVNQLVILLDRYKQKLKEYDVTTIKVIATTAVREAENKNLLLDTVLRKTGFKIEILNAGDVVYYIDSFLSLKLKKTYPIYEKNLLIAELGAGSLDISIMEKGYTLFNFGVPLGTLRLKQFKEKLDGSIEETNEAITEYIENAIFYLKEILPRLQIDDVILIDETYSSYIQNVLNAKNSNQTSFSLKRRKLRIFQRSF